MIVVEWLKRTDCEVAARGSNTVDHKFFCVKGENCIGRSSTCVYNYSSHNFTIRKSSTVDMPLILFRVQRRVMLSKRLGTEMGIAIAIKIVGSGLGLYCNWQS